MEILKIFLSSYKIRNCIDILSNPRYNKVVIVF